MDHPGRHVFCSVLFSQPPAVSYSCVAPCVPTAQHATYRNLEMMDGMVAWRREHRESGGVDAGRDQGSRSTGDDFGSQRAKREPKCTDLIDADG